MFFDGIRMMGIGIECQQFFLGFSKETCADHAITFYLTSTLRNGTKSSLFSG